MGSGFGFRAQVCKPAARTCVHLKCRLAAVYSSVHVHGLLHLVQISSAPPFGLTSVLAQQYLASCTVLFRSLQS